MNYWKLKVSCNSAPFCLFPAKTLATFHLSYNVLLSCALGQDSTISGKPVIQELDHVMQYCTLLVAKFFNRILGIAETADSLYILLNDT